jgi:drug/metabolite transporter (DMT)-like permease
VSPALAGDLFTVGSSLCFAGSNIMVAQGNRPGAEDNGAFISLIITTLIAGALWAGLGFARGFEPVTARALLWFAGAGVFTAFVGRVFFYASIEKLGAMRSSTMKRLIPFFAVTLGVGVLGERITAGMLAGMGLIVASFAMLVGGARASQMRGETGQRRGLNAGYVYGPVSALGYATGYLLRKMGLADAHDALLGAALGCLAGIAMFVATAAFSASYARSVRATFSRPNPWLVAAGVMSSFGQILYFAALNENPMARVALVSSVEVFITLFLGAVFLRRSESLTPALVAAAVLGFAGTAAVISF